MNAYTNDIPGMTVLCQDRETGTFCPVKSGISVWLIKNFMLYVVHPHDTDTSWHVGMIPGATEPCPTPGAISANLSPPHSMQLGARLSRFTYIYIVQRGNHITYDIMLEVWVIWCGFTRHINMLQVSLMTKHIFTPAIHRLPSVCVIWYNSLSDCLIDFYNVAIDLIFGRRIGSTAADAPVQFQIDVCIQSSCIIETRESVFQESSIDP